MFSYAWGAHVIDWVLLVFAAIFTIALLMGQAIDSAIRRWERRKEIKRQLE